jgi:hypothetical protein
MAVPLLAAIALTVAPAMAGARQIRHATKHKLALGTSTNWSGYSVDGTGATFVTASWVQPYATDCALVPNSWSSPWVGIDGDSSNTVEQTGTDSDCSGGSPSYSAWWEMYPKSAVLIPSIVVHPGDSFTATVSYGSAGFTLTLSDNTTGQSFTTVQTSKKARRSSAEWIMEGPASGNLTDFGSIGFTNASATIGGQTVSPSSPNANTITMVTNSGVDRAVPSLSGPNSFGITWQHS